MIKVSASEVRMGISANGDHYLDLSTGKLAEEEHTLDLETGHMRFTCIEDVHSSPDRYVLLPHINNARIRNEFLHCHLSHFREEDLRRYDIPMDETFDEYYQRSDVETCNRQYEFTKKTHNLFEDYNVEDAYLDYDKECREELIAKWCKERGLELIDDDPKKTNERWISWNKTTMQDFEIVKKKLFKQKT